MKHLGIDTKEKAYQIIEDAFKVELILPKNQYVIIECIEEIIEGSVDEGKRSSQKKSDLRED